MVLLGSGNHVLETELDPAFNAPHFGSQRLHLTRDALALFDELVQPTLPIGHRGVRLGDIDHAGKIAVAILVAAYRSAQFGKTLCLLLTENWLHHDLRANGLRPYVFEHLFATDYGARISRSRDRFRDPRATQRTPVTVATVSDGIAQIEAESPAAFRTWLEKHHETEPALWLIFWKKGSGHPSIEWSEAVDVALCFGWIDSKIQSLDDNRYRQYFSPRKPGSGWSRINKDKVRELTASGLIAPAGLAVIDRAKEDGSWTLFDGPEAGVVPDDLAAALDTAAVRQTFEGLSQGGRKAILSWLVMAKRPQTRTNRIERTVASLKKGEHPLS